MTTWMRMGRLIQFTPGLHALAVVLQIARLSMILVPGLIVREVFNGLTGQSAWSAPIGTGFWLLVAGLVVVAVVRVTTVLTAIFVEYTASFYSSSLLRKNLFAHILDTAHAGSLAHAPGDVVSRLEADTRIIGEYVRALTLVIGTAAGAILALIIMVGIDLLMTVAAVLPLLLVGVVVHLAGSNLGRLRRAKRTADGHISAFLVEMFAAVQAVKVNTAEEQVIAHLRPLSARRRQAALREVMFQDLILSGSEQMTAISTGVILLLADQAMHAGTFTVGDFALFIAFLAPVADFTTRFGQNLAAYRQVNVSWERLGQLLPDTPAHTLTVPSPVYLDGAVPNMPRAIRSAGDRLTRLEVTEIRYWHPGTRRGIDRVSFRLDRGSVTVITGRVGAGKTTLLRILLGALPKFSGEIRWNGRLIEDPAHFFIPPRCAYTPQVPRLFSEPLRDNILMGLPEEEAHLERAVRLAVLTRDIADLAAGLETMVGPRGITLSGGQIQRAAAARMFARESELLVCDDLSSALDGETEQTLWQHIFELPDVTCLAVSHHKTVLRRADQIIVLKDGGVAGCGALGDLLATCEEFEQLWQGKWANDGTEEDYGS